MKKSKHFTLHQPQLTSPHPDAFKYLKERYAQGDLEAFPPSHGDVIGRNDAIVVPPHPDLSPQEAKQTALVRNKKIKGTSNLLIVLVEFSDVKFKANIKNDFQNLFFADAPVKGIAPYGSVRSYYNEVSNNKVKIDGHIYGPYTLKHTQAYYAHNAFGLSNAVGDVNIKDLAGDAMSALRKAEPKLDLSKYDNDGDHQVEGFVVVHAGPDAARTSHKDDIWPAKWILRNPVKIGKTSVNKFLTIAGAQEDIKIGTPCHEIGHLLFGFPDLYDTDNKDNAGIGEWGLMGAGNWLGDRNRPCHPSAWCKIHAGWVTVKDIVCPGELLIDPVLHTHTVYRYYVDNNQRSKEYFLIENRQKIGFDTDLRGEGLLIWHIDDSIPDNTSENHPKVRLIQADGKNDLVTGNKKDRGDKGDPYPGSSKTTKFTFTSKPSSKNYSLNDSGLKITNISQKGLMMFINIQLLGALQIGNQYAGGIIFKLNPDRKSGLVISEKDLGEYNWEEASRVCKDLDLAGYTDWELPSSADWNLIYYNLGEHSPSNLNRVGTYWTSTPGYGPGWARARRINDGWNPIWSSASHYHVRAMRRF
jgi:immune inhibitor A